jgi:hypothetical protein
MKNRYDKPKPGLRVPAAVWPVDASAMEEEDREHRGSGDH